ncbi:hypothetical protein BAC2_03021 [uncultured bacterium]|nr:hypothetical protein BAC2_03021 [uncultured bacterium]
MGNTPAGRPNLSKPLIMGAVLAVLGVVLFLVIYIALAESEAIIRLFVAMCVPPAVIAAIIGVYVLVARPGNSQ